MRSTSSVAVPDLDAGSAGHVQERVPHLVERLNRELGNGNAGREPRAVTEFSDEGAGRPLSFDGGLLSLDPLVVRPGVPESHYPSGEVFSRNCCLVRRGARGSVSS